MADIADVAGEHDFNEEIMARHKNKPASTIPRGVCLYCEETIAADKVYCDTDCRDMHEREERLLHNKRK